jgi:diphthamide synthase (EF-2-diphthine--ammonia ligase)
VDTAQVAAEFAGRIYDEALLRDLPTTADPCGENGEFHTFVFDGPLFREPVAFARGEVVTRDRFRFCDLTPAAAASAAQAG